MTTKFIETKTYVFEERSQEKIDCVLVRSMEKQKPSSPDLMLMLSQPKFIIGFQAKHYPVSKLTYVTMKRDRLIILSASLF
jgi:hypothetical protein